MGVHDKILSTVLHVWDFSYYIGGKSKSNKTTLQVCFQD